MICNPLQLTAQAGLTPQSFATLAERENHFVARVETTQGPVLFKADTAVDDCKWDAKHITLLAAAGLPVPEILAQGETPVSYIILRWLEGEPLTSESPLEAQHEAGRLLHTIHHLQERPAYARPYPYDEWMKGWLNVALPWWGEHPDVTTQMVDEAWRAFEELRPLLATRNKHFTLQDGRPDHFIVRDGRIVGIIDLHDAQGGDGAMDLGVMGVLDEPLMHNVLDGYEADPTEAEELEKVVPYYLFLRRLAAADWHGRFGSQTIAKQAMTLANQYPLTRP